MALTSIKIDGKEVDFAKAPVVEMEIGYIPKETEMVDGVLTHKNAELIEVSVAPEGIKYFEEFVRGKAKIEAKKIDVKKFRMNPVVVQNHDYSQPAIGKVIGIRQRHTKKHTILEFDVQYSPEFLERVRGFAWECKKHHTFGDKGFTCAYCGYPNNKKEGKMTATKKKSEKQPKQKMPELSISCRPATLATRLKQAWKALTAPAVEVEVRVIKKKGGKRAKTKRTTA